MSRGWVLILLVLLVAPAASAEDKDTDEEGYGDEQLDKKVKLEMGPLENSSPFSLQAGWRYAPNTKFFNNNYSKPENRRLTRADGTFGGPLVVGTFAYSPLEWLEVGMDMFFTYERMAITQMPALNTLSFGLMIGVRAQKKLELTAGATLRLSPTWGVCFEYRLTFAYGQAEKLGLYDAGGSWFSVGLTRILPKVKDRPLPRRF